MSVYRVAGHRLSKGEGLSAGHWLFRYPRKGRSFGQVMAILKTMDEGAEHGAGCRLLPLEGDR